MIVKMFSALPGAVGAFPEAAAASRRSGKIAKQYYKKFCNFEGSLAKDPKGLFDKLTVRLAGRYISFMRLDVEKVALVIARPCRGRGNLAGSLRIFGKLRRIRNILCEISTSLRPLQ